MERRQLEWGWLRVRRPEPEARAPRHPEPVVSETLETGLEELERFNRDVGCGRIGPVRVGREHVTVRLRAADDQLYHLRIGTRGYPNQAPSCTFVDARGRPTAAAWPARNVNGPFRPPRFICTPPTAEFYQYHSEREFDARDGTLVNTVGTIFTALNDRAYRGRHDAGRGRAPGGRRRGRPGE